MGIIADIGERVGTMRFEAAKAARPDMEPALIIYSWAGLCAVRMDRDILPMLSGRDLEVRFEDRPLFGCSQEEDPRATHPWIVLTRRAAETRRAPAMPQERRKQA